MYYFALLHVRERAVTAEDTGREIAAYTDFHARAAAAILAGDALASAAEEIRISGGPDAPVVTDGPFAEGTEVAGGYYVFEADDLDEALQLARQIPAAQRGSVEVWPMVHYNPVGRPTTSADWFALLLEPAEHVAAPGSAEWEAGARRHVDFGAAAGQSIVGGAPLHLPSTATTVRVRDGEVLLTDGPYAEGAEVANGFYILSAADRDEAVKLASMIPASGVALRPLAGVSGL